MTKPNPTTALVIAWHYANTPQGQIPEWIKALPDYPPPGPGDWAAYQRLVAAARPAIERLQRKLTP